MKVKVLKMHPDAVLPNKTYPNDFCYDCVAVSEQEVAPNVWKYGLGLAMQIERDELNLMHDDICFAIDARPRSSVWKTGMVLSNCVGTIDENYTGEISAVFYHVNTTMPRYKVGDRIVQIKLNSALAMEFVEVDSLSKTDRGEGGYGSTGK
jgi:dUTP pyrophosphatase